MEAPRARPGPPRPGRCPGGASARAPGRGLRRRDARPRRPHRGGAGPLPERPPRRRRPRPARPRARQARAWPRSAGGPPSCTRCTTRSPRSSPSSGSTRRRRRPLRPRRLLDAARRARARVRLRRGRAARHADGRQRRARPPPTCSTPTRPRSSPGSCAVRRGEVRQADRPRDREGRARPSRSATSARLVELLRDTIPAPARRTGGHPAKRTFQALRIEVNDELGVLRRAIPAAVAAIRVGGRVVVMSYHSLEDRLVKQAFAAGTTSRAPPDLPVVPPGLEPPLRHVTRGAEKAARKRSTRTRAQPRSGCAPSNASTGKKKGRTAA